MHELKKFWRLCWKVIRNRKWGWRHFWRRKGHYIGLQVVVVMVAVIIAPITLACGCLIAFLLNDLADIVRYALDED